ncbi:ABC transporter permease [Streptomyces coffeae]|uniref:ABC transporter permease n=1 Tax=Streptomyces coffeae TaxID=621382 RepID=A0ABS1NDH3_9ACTN|nr:ABC transporter permease [Streptomyces coffeae]MBL1097945.1 ABC transporter permease [Streptomyces coffeae]
MSALTSSFHVVRYSAANAVADFRATYTWRSWTFGWLGRMLAQVTFFATMGLALHSSASAHYLVVGNSVMTCVVEAMTVVTSSAWERRQGTLPLLAASPARLIWVFFGRSLQWPVSGTVTSLVALLGLGPLFGVTWSPGQVPVLVGLVLLTAVSTYCVGLFLAAFVLSASNARNIVSNVGYLVMMAICGVQVPVSFWPDWVGVVAQSLPLTHTLAAVRGVAAHAGAGDIALRAGWAVLAGACWLGAAAVAFTRLQIHARRNGHFSFAE